MSIRWFELGVGVALLGVALESVVIVAVGAVVCIVEAIR